MYDESKTILENSQSSINNLMFDYYWARLSDYDTFHERYTPGGFETLKAKKPEMLLINYGSQEDFENIEKAVKEGKSYISAFREASEEWKGRDPKYDPSSPMTLAHYQVTNAMYDKLIGSAANDNINGRLTSLLAELKLNHPIKFGSLVTATMDKDKVGCDIKAKMINGVDTEALSGENLAAAVDAVKDALLEFYGITQEDFGIACFMAKIGATAEDIGLLLNQPVVKSAIQKMNDSEYHLSLGDALQESLEDMFGKDIWKKQKNVDTYSSFANSDTRNEYLTTENLIKNIVDYKTKDISKNGDALTRAMAVAKTMLELQTVSMEFREQINMSKGSSTNSVPSSIGEIQNTQHNAETFSSEFGGEASSFSMKVENGVETSNTLRNALDPINTFGNSQKEQDKFIDKYINSPYCLEQSAQAALHKYMKEVIFQLFPYNSRGFTAISEGLSLLTARNKLSADIYNTINREMSIYMTNRMVDMFKDNFQPMVYNGRGELVTIGLNNYDFYTKAFPIIFKVLLQNNQKLKKEGAAVLDYSKFTLIGSLMNTRNRGLQLNTIGSLDRVDKDALTESWEQMFLSGDPVLQNIAIHLFMWGKYATPDKFSRTNFNSLAPTCVKEYFSAKTYEYITTGEDRLYTTSELAEQSSYLNSYNQMFNTVLVDGEITTGDRLKKGEKGLFKAKDAIKSMILRHPEWYQFTKDAYIGRDDNPSPLRKAIDLKLASSQDKTRFTLDASIEADYQKIKSVVTPHYVTNKDGKKEIDYYTFIPQIRIYNKEESTWDVYICDNSYERNDNFDCFNISESGSMTYYKMMPVEGSTDFRDIETYSADKAAERRQQEDDLEDVLSSFINTEVDIAAYEENTHSPIRQTRPKSLDEDNSIGSTNLETTDVNITKQMNNHHKKLVETMKEDLNVYLRQLSSEKYKNVRTHITNMYNDVFTSLRQYMENKNDSQCLDSTISNLMQFETVLAQDTTTVDYESSGKIVAISVFIHDQILQYIGEIRTLMNMNKKSQKTTSKNVYFKLNNMEKQEAQDLKFKIESLNMIFQELEIARDPLTEKLKNIKEQFSTRISSLSSSINPNIDQSSIEIHNYENVKSFFDNVYNQIEEEINDGSITQQEGQKIINNSKQRWEEINTILNDEGFRKSYRKFLESQRQSITSEEVDNFCNDQEVCG